MCVREVVIYGKLKDTICVLEVVVHKKLKDTLFVSLRL